MKQLDLGKGDGNGSPVVLLSGESELLVLSVEDKGVNWDGHFPDYVVLHHVIVQDLESEVLIGPFLVAGENDLFVPLSLVDVLLDLGLVEKMTIPVNPIAPVALNESVNSAEESIQVGQFLYGQMEVDCSPPLRSRVPPCGSLTASSLFRSTTNWSKLTSTLPTTSSLLKVSKSTTSNLRTCPKP